MEINQRKILEPMRWITIAAVGDTRQVKCSECGYKVTYHAGKIPKRCLSCKAIPEPDTSSDGRLTRFSSPKSL